MNVWIIDHYSSEPQYGGISRQYDFAKGLSDEGVNVLVISSSFSHYSHEYISQKKVYTSAINTRANYAYLRTTSYDRNGGLKRILNTFSFVSSVKRNSKNLVKNFGAPDVVVGCSIHPFTWIAANWVAQKYDARFLVEVRDLWPANQIYDEGMSPYHPMALILGALERWAYNKAECVIYSMSRGDKYICDICQIPREKTLWLAQPMDCERFDANSKRYDELPQSIRTFIGESFICVFTGYYMEYEGVNEMLEAAAILKEKDLPIKFVFVGNGDEERKMKAFVKNNDLSNVFIGGRIQKDLVPALLKRAQICLAHLAVKGNPQSYQFDASKNKINEYMYSDSCIIYGTYVENQFVKTSGAGFTIEPYNAMQFATTIEKVYKMAPEQRKVFGENARKYVMANNTLDCLTQKYLTVLKK